MTAGLPSLHHRRPARLHRAREPRPRPRRDPQRGPRVPDRPHHREPRAGRSPQGGRRLRPADGARHPLRHRPREAGPARSRARDGRAVARRQRAAGARRAPDRAARAGARASRRCSCPRTMPPRPRGRGLEVIAMRHPARRGRVPQRRAARSRLRVRTRRPGGPAGTDRRRARLRRRARPGARQARAGDRGGRRSQRAHDRAARHRQDDAGPPAGGHPAAAVARGGDRGVDRLERRRAALARSAACVASGRSAARTTPISEAGLIGGGGVPHPGRDQPRAPRRPLPRRAARVLHATCSKRSRQPLEDARVAVSRAAGTVAFPARFQLVAAANPCRRGCPVAPTLRLLAAERVRYLGRLSRPLLDRIDLHLEIPALSPRRAHRERRGRAAPPPSARAWSRRARARSRRFAGTDLHANARMSGRQTRRFCALPPDAARLLGLAVTRLGLSARAHDRLLARRAHHRRPRRRRGHRHRARRRGHPVPHARSRALSVRCRRLASAAQM